MKEQILYMTDFSNYISWLLSYAPLNEYMKRVTTIACVQLEQLLLQKCRTWSIQCWISLLLSPNFLFGSLVSPSNKENTPTSKHDPSHDSPPQLETKSQKHFIARLFCLNWIFQCWLKQAAVSLTFLHHLYVMSHMCRSLEGRVSSGGTNVVLSFFMLMFVWWSLSLNVLM